MVLSRLSCPARFFKVNGSMYFAQRVSHACLASSLETSILLGYQACEALIGQPCAALGIVACLDLMNPHLADRIFCYGQGNRGAQECLAVFMNGGNI